MIHTTRRIASVCPAWPTGTLLLLLVAALFGNPATAQTVWSPANNGIYGGTVTAFAFPAAQSILAATGHGIYSYISSDDGWSINDHGLVVHAFGLGTSGTIVGASDVGIQRSGDGGAHWSEVFTGRRPTIFSTTSRGTILAVVTGSSTAPDSGASLRSIDDGIRWEPLRIDTGIVRTTALISSPSGSAFALADGRIYRSTDDGLTFRPIPAPPSAQSVSLVADRRDSSLLAATALDGIHRSTDDGQSWTKIDTLLAATLVVATNGDLYAVVNQRTTWYIPRNGINRSTDGGRSWMRLTPVQPRQLAAAPNGDLWVAAANTILVSSDHGMNWKTAVKGIANTSIPEIVADSTGYAYSKSDGIYFRTSDNGANWTSLVNNPGIEQLQAAPGGRIFGVVVEPGEFPHFDRTFDVLHVSSDHGESWKEIARDHHLGAIAVNTTGTIACGSRRLGDSSTLGGRITYSFDNGATWQESEVGGVTNVAVTASGMLLAGILEESDAGPLYGALRGTVDSGRTWSVIRDSVKVSTLAASPDGILYAQMSRLKADGSPGLDEVEPGFHRSTDNGRTWEQLLSDTAVGSMRFNHRGDIVAEITCPDSTSPLVRSVDSGGSWHPSTLENGIPVMPQIFRPNGESFALANGDIHRSTDYGATWKLDIGGMRQGSVLVLARDAAGYLYAGSKGDGLFRSALPSSRELPPAPTARRNSFIEPNPLRDHGTIIVTLAHPGSVRIDINDPLGQLLRTVAADPGKAGRNRFELDASGLPPGAYFLQITTADSATVVPIIVQ